MQDTDNFNGFAIVAIKDEIILDYEMANTGSDVLAGWTGKGMGGESGACTIQPIHQAVSRLGVIHGYVKPDIKEVLFGASGAADLGKHQALFCLMARRRLPSALMSAAERLRPGPLSRPSCNSLRSSSTV